jgi:hypothetical protein
MHLRWQRIGVVGFVIGHGWSPIGDAIERNNVTRTLVKCNEGILKKRRRRRRIKGETD